MVFQYSTTIYISTVLLEKLAHVVYTIMNYDIFNASMLSDHVFLAHIRPFN